MIGSNGLLYECSAGRFAAWAFHGYFAGFSVDEPALLSVAWSGYLSYRLPTRSSKAKCETFRTLPQILLYSGASEDKNR